MKQVKSASRNEATIETVLVDHLSDGIDYVLDTVNSLLEDENYRNVAIIGRKRSQIIPYQIVFASESIPFYAAEDLNVFLSEAFKELREMLAIKARMKLKGIFASDPVADLLKLCDKIKRFRLSWEERKQLRNYLERFNPSSLEEASLALRRYRGPLKRTRGEG